MGAPKQKWTPEEEDALRAGVEKHGPGKWRTIQKDPEFSHFLSTRSNIDLKDKWRNMSVSAGGQGSREKSRSSKNKAILATSLLGSHGTVSTSVKEGTLPITLDQAKNFKDGSAIPRYAQLIVEALKAMPDSEGMPISAICNYIEQRLSVPPNFRRLLSSKLRRLVAQNKIIKGPRGYMLKESSFATKTPTPKQKDLSHHRPKMSSHSPSFSSATSRTDEASKTAAYRIAEAEAKMYLASEAVKEAETVSRMAEETDSLLLIAKEIYERCLRGEIVTIA